MRLASDGDRTRPDRERRQREESDEREQRRNHELSVDVVECDKREEGKIKGM